MPRSNTVASQDTEPMVFVGNVTNQ